MLRALCALVLLSLLAPVVGAAAQEVDLPATLRAPTALVVDEAGRVWFTLDGTWAVARYDPASAAPPAVWALPTQKGGQFDSLYGLDLASDGTAWTASQSSLHRVDPQTGKVDAFDLGAQTQISGGVLAADEAVLVGVVGADRLARFDRATGEVALVAPPAAPFGPLEFARADDGAIYVTATYANTYATVDAATGAMTAGPADLVMAPTGIAWHDGLLWIGEHGGASVMRVDPATDAWTRFPTPPSPYYPGGLTGPSGVAVAEDGAVWFVEHFADRLARLDPQALTLVEYELPSAPGTNAQHLALAPDGAAWIAETTKHKLAFARDGGESPSFTVPASVTLRRGGTASFNVEGAMGGRLLANSGLEGLNATVEGARVTLTAADVAAGEHLVVVSEQIDAKTYVGRYVRVHVEESSSTPAPSVALVTGVIALAALAAARRRRA